MLPTQLDAVIEPAIRALGYELLGCELFRQKNSYLLRVFVDGPQGINIEECAKLSRQISAVLDVADPLPGRYYLEVSSPGIERPLFKVEHYQRYIGQLISVRLRTPREGRRQFTGKLLAVIDNRINLELNDSIPGTMVTIALNEISKAHLKACY